MKVLPGSAFVFALGLVGAQRASAVDVCPESSSVHVDFACTFTGDYRTGEPKDVVTISVGPGGETLAENGITIRICLRDCAGRPLVGVPADSVFLVSSWLCICPGGTSADGATDASGCTTFTGALHAGGCAPALDVVVGCRMIGQVPVKTNSPVRLPGRCDVSSDAVSSMVHGLSSGSYTICNDLNEDGHVDGADFVQLVTRYYAHWCEDLLPCPRQAAPSEDER